MIAVPLGACDPGIARNGVAASWNIRHVYQIVRRAQVHGLDGVYRFLADAAHQCERAYRRMAESDSEWSSLALRRAASGWHDAVLSADCWVPELPDEQPAAQGGAA